MFRKHGTVQARFRLRHGYLLAVLATLLVAAIAWAGDPIPDIDIVPPSKRAPPFTLHL